MNIASNRREVYEGYSPPGRRRRFFIGMTALHPLHPLHSAPLCSLSAPPAWTLSVPMLWTATPGQCRHSPVHNRVLLTRTMYLSNLSLVDTLALQTCRCAPGALLGLLGAGASERFPTPNAPMRDALGQAGLGRLPTLRDCHATASPAHVRGGPSRVHLQWHTVAARHGPAATPAPAAAAVAADAGAQPRVLAPCHAVEADAPAARA